MSRTYKDAPFWVTTPVSKKRSHGRTRHWCNDEFDNFYPWHQDNMGHDCNLGMKHKGGEHYFDCIYVMREFEYSPYDNFMAGRSRRTVRSSERMVLREAAKTYNEYGSVVDGDDTTVDDTDDDTYDFLYECDAKIAPFHDVE